MRYLSAAITSLAVAAVPSIGKIWVTKIGEIFDTELWLEKCPTNYDELIRRKWLRPWKGPNRTKPIQFAVLS